MGLRFRGIRVAGEGPAYPYHDKPGRNGSLAHDEKGGHHAAGCPRDRPFTQEWLTPFGATETIP